MARIKFSHTSEKLLGPDGKPVQKAKLLVCLAVPQEQICRALDFIAYDTDQGKYTIPFSSFYLILLFQKPDGNLFTTVRPQFSRETGDKKPYYDSLVGKELDIVIESK